MEQVCRFYQQGRCSFGNACRLVHILPGAEPTGTSSSSSSSAPGGSGSGDARPYSAASANSPLPEVVEDFFDVATAASASTVAGSPAAEEREAEVKELRKLQKALREIESLEAKRDAGEGLQANQLKKIEKRSETEQRMRELEESIRQRDAAPPPAPPVAMPVAQPRRTTERAPIGPDVGTVCRHYLAGRCSFGNACRNTHTLDGAPPTRVRPLEPAFDAEDPECGICFESILKKGEKFGILENCDHAFCLSCIRSWRKQREQQDRQNLRLCPVCRNESFFVVPSDAMMEPEQKLRAIESYKVEKARVPCKLFDYGRGNCPFGTSCFYVHLNPDGTRYIPRALHWRKGADGSEVQADVKLSDFLVHSLALP